MDIKTYNEYGKDLEYIYKLPTMPIAMKFCEKTGDVPVGAISPKRDMGKHMAFCQALAYARFSGITVAMTKEDHWCWNPLIGFGSVECVPGQESFDEVIRYLGIDDHEKAVKFFADFPRLPLNKYEAVVVGPLSSANFLPDVVLIYGLPGTINQMFLIEKALYGKHIESVFDGIDSCVYSTVTPFVTGECQVTFPDPGELQRANASPNEVILTIPASHLEAFMTKVKAQQKFGMRRMMPPDLELDFARPPFYNSLFEKWGLEKGNDWSMK